ncbi:hypothetical protein [Acaryochloris sp. CCMEE 5410]|uniref:hypothetical protein n=1 Tax=Acaryochloris sp. CCMEE 5410 TaxID=310037 RepID=UPI0002483BE9|nr:hypothetical protein [Acaryochloris sp. CCMEE 5410]KAI9134264.1 hypothetical protein ON05_013890 [Acaryochloris sp. CCMEE 5410]
MPQLGQVVGYSLGILGLTLSGYPLMACELPQQSIVGNDPAFNHMPLIQDQKTLQQYGGQTVTLQGRYVAQKQIPDITSAGIWNPEQPPIPHIRATIVLKDGTSVSLYPPTHKQSLRSPEEADQFDQQTVRVEGTVEANTVGSSSSRWVIRPVEIQLASP